MKFGCDKVGSWVWQFSFQAQFLAPRETFPMPFRWIYWLAKIVYKCKKKNYVEAAKQDKQKYFFLLRELILNKQESDKEISYEDKIDDLKKDIINEVRKIYLQDKFDDLQKNIIDEIKNVHLQDKFDDLQKNIIEEIKNVHL